MTNLIYLDNAATTAIRPEVVDEMTRVLSAVYGNPSSTHAIGRLGRSEVEMARKKIAANLGCSAQEILFTSGATEANNWVFRSAIVDFKIERIITSRIEHHAVLHTAEHYASAFSVDLEFVRVLPDGSVDLEHLEELLSEETPTLVSLMHVNNEIGNVLDLEKTGEICRKYNALFHSDTVQSVGKTEISLRDLPLDFAVASAHKFHGPKGVGFMYVRKGLVISPMLFGGEQEKGVRPGTESVHNISGMAKALELSYSNLADERSQIADLKEYAVDSLQSDFPGMKINGVAENGFYNLLNVCLPIAEEKTAMILFHLEMKGICVSRGSACQSGSIKPSHVLAEMLGDEDIRKPSLRISFSHYNTKSDVDALVSALKSL